LIFSFFIIISTRRKIVEYSPVLAIFTGVFEFSAAVFAFLSRGRKQVLYPVGLLLLFLAGYQFSEVAVCSNPGNLLYSRIAFFDITWLPVIGLWLIFQLSPPQNKWFRLIPGFYFTAGLALSVWIIADANCISKSVCEVVIARFFSPNPFDTLYGVFYQTGIAFMVFFSVVRMVYTEDKIIRKHLMNLQTGVLGFVLPSLALRVLLDKPGAILPSVMCHFAIILALSLVFVILREKRLFSSSAPDVNYTTIV